VNAQRYARWFETLTPEAVEEFPGVFAPQARFQDPFNDVRGVAAIQRIFRHMFEQCASPRFEVIEIIEQGTIAYLRWYFRFGADKKTRQIEGVSRVEFDARGLVISHIDYWDPATQLYEKLPLLGSLLRSVKKRLSAES